MVKQAVPVLAAILVSKQAEASFGDTLAKIPVLPTWLSAALVGVAAGMVVHKVIG